MASGDGTGLGITRRVGVGRVSSFDADGSAGTDDAMAGLDSQADTLLSWSAESEGSRGHGAGNRVDGIASQASLGASTAATGATGGTGATLPTATSQTAASNYTVVPPAPSLLARQTSHASVSAFVKSVLLTIIPGPLWGDAHTRRHLLHNVDTFVRLRRFETLSSEQVMTGLSTTAFTWAGPVANDTKARGKGKSKGRRTGKVKAPRLPPEDHALRTSLVRRWIHFVSAPVAVARWLCTPAARCCVAAFRTSAK